MSMSPPRLVVAIGYRDAKGAITVPECPYCYCVHRHRDTSPPRDQPAELQSTTLREWNDGDIVRLSDCTGLSHPYLLSIREEELPPIVPVVCHGHKKNGDECRLLARKGYCTCLRHMGQIEQIIEERYQTLHGPNSASSDSLDIVD